MKITLGIVVVVLMIGAPSVYAETAYESGFKHGVSDARIKPSIHCPGLEHCHWYILEIGKSFAFHIPDFNRGYVAGYYSISGPHTGFEAEQASWDCDKGPDSWNYEIR
jgi:hypothetical protein